MRAELRPRALLLGAVIGAIGVIVTAQGDTFRTMRAQLVSHSGVRDGMLVLAIWSVVLVVTRVLLPARSRRSRAWPLARTGIEVVGGVIGVWLLWRSLGWGVRLDAPMVLYPARQFITGERTPYLELVEFNQPATYLLYGVIDQLVTTDVGLRVLDTALVIAAAVLSREALRLEAWSSAALVGALFTVTHLAHTGVDCLQREMFLLVLTLGAGALLLQRRWLWAGVVAAVIFWMKFHGLILLAPFVWAVVREGASAPRALFVGLARFGGVIAIASALVLGALASAGALGAWYEMVSEYLPLYGQMSGTWTFSVDAEQVWTRRLWLFFHPEQHPAVLGLLLLPPLLMMPRPASALPDPRMLACGLYVSGLAYTLAQGTFWHYQSIPAVFAIGAMIAALLRYAPSALERAPQLALIAIVGWHLYSPPALADVDWEASGRNDEAVAMADLLRSELPPGETVQPIETVTGALDAMWRADVPLATSFVFDIVFYHHLERPVIQRWRRRFLDELEHARPYFLLESVGGYRARPYGPGAAETFPELEAWIRANYVVHRTSGSFRWWRRRDAAPP